MGELESVQELLLQLRRGEADALVRLLVLLTDRPLYLQAQLRTQGREENKLALLTVTEGERAIVPVFTSQSAAVDDASDSIVVALSGAELAATLPKDRWLRFDTGSRHEVLLPPRALALLGQAESLQLLQAMSEPELAPPKSAPPGVETAPLRTSTPDPLTPLSADHEQVVQDLDAVFREFPEIQEAYYIETTDETGGPVVGLLTQTISVERRFELISQLADVSRKHFDEAGAIEVYDDLHSRSSHSWSLFNAQTPIFFRAPEAENSEYRNTDASFEEPLNRQIAVQRVLRERSGTERISAARLAAELPAGTVKERYDRSPTERIDRKSFLESGQLEQITSPAAPYAESLFEAQEPELPLSESGEDESQVHGGRLGRFIAGLRARR